MVPNLTPILGHSGNHHTYNLGSHLWDDGMNISVLWVIFSTDHIIITVFKKGWLNLCKQSSASLETHHFEKWANLVWLLQIIFKKEVPFFQVFWHYANLDFNIMELYYIRSTIRLTASAACTLSMQKVVSWYIRNRQSFLSVVKYCYCWVYFTVSRKTTQIFRTIIECFLQQKLHGEGRQVEALITWGCRDLSCMEDGNRSW